VSKVNIAPRSSFGLELEPEGEEEGHFIEAPRGLGGVPQNQAMIRLGDPMDIVDCWADEEEPPKKDAGDNDDSTNSIVEDAIREMELELAELFQDEEDNIDLDQCFINLDKEVSPCSKAAFALKKQQSVLLVDGQSSSTTGTSTSRDTPQEGGEPTIEGEAPVLKRV